MPSCFAFIGVENGWFKVLFYSHNSSILLWSTDVGSYDVGKILIDAICSFIRKDTEKETILFNEEIKAHLLTLNRSDNEITLSVNELKGAPFDYLGVKQSIQSNEILEQPVFEVTFPLKQLAQNIFSEFAKYNQRDFIKEYESNWFPFPVAELDYLKKIIKQL